MKKLILGLSVYGMLVSNIMADDCKSWTWDNEPIKFKTCVYSSGGSGYIKIKNTGSRDVNVCWVLKYDDGRRSKGCKSRLAGYDEERSSEYHLSKSDLDGITLTKFKYLK